MTRAAEASARRTREALALLPCQVCSAAGPHHLFDEEGGGATAVCTRCGADIVPAAAAVPAIPAIHPEEPSDPAFWTRAPEPG